MLLWLQVTQLGRVFDRRLVGHFLAVFGSFHHPAVVGRANLARYLVAESHVQGLDVRTRHDHGRVALRLEERLADDLGFRTGILVALLDQGPLAEPGGGVEHTLLEDDLARLPVKVFALFLQEVFFKQTFKIKSSVAKRGTPRLTRTTILWLPEF